MVTEDYVSYEVAKLLKEKGFDIYTSTRYDYEGAFHFHGNYLIGDSDISAPTHQRAMKWLRDEKEIFVCPKLRCFFDGKQHYYKWEPTILRLPSNNIIYPQPLDMCKYYESYTEAVEAALKYVLENLI